MYSQLLDYRSWDTGPSSSLFGSGATPSLQVGPRQKKFAQVGWMRSAMQITSHKEHIILLPSHCLVSSDRYSLCVVTLDHHVGCGSNPSVPTITLLVGENLLCLMIMLEHQEIKAHTGRSILITLSRYLSDVKICAATDVNRKYC